MTTRPMVFICRAFASARPKTRLSSDSFGSLHRTDIPVERLVRSKGVDFEAATQPRKIKELSIPLALSKKKREELEKQQSKEPIPPGHKCFIECSRPEFNLLESRPDLRTPLCSQYWDKNKYKDEWFVIRRKTKASSSQFVKWENAWEHYVPDRLDPLVRETLEELKLKIPTQVQSQCLQVFPSHYHLFIAAETGSGKTIAYLAPLITRLLKQKRKNVKVKERGAFSRIICHSCRHLIAEGTDILGSVEVCIKSGTRRLYVQLENESFRKLRLILHHVSWKRVHDACARNALEDDFTD
ncbi:hypothetical protein OSTOST_23269, partial [Ostertagia ostertagi]